MAHGVQLTNHQSGSQKPVRRTEMQHIIPIGPIAHNFIIIREHQSQHPPTLTYWQIHTQTSLAHPQLDTACNHHGRRDTGTCLYIYEHCNCTMANERVALR